MSSKYDIYWRTRMTDIKRLLREAHKTGRSSELDIPDIMNYGQRKTWYGVVEVSKNGIGKGEMAHARSLGRAVQVAANPRRKSLIPE